MIRNWKTKLKKYWIIMCILLIIVVIMFFLANFIHGCNSNKSILSGKKIVVFGDNVAWGLCGDNARQARMTWPEALEESTGATVDNKAILATNLSVAVGYGILERQNRYAFCNIIDKVDLSDYDYCLIAYGTSDYGYSCDIGNINSKRKSTYMGALNYSLQKIISQNPSIKIFIISPMYIANEESANAKGNILQDYRDAMQSIAEKYDVFYIDMKEAFGINESNIDNFYWSSPCPYEEKYIEIGQYIAEELENICTINDI